MKRKKLALCGTLLSCITMMVSAEVEVETLLDSGTNLKTIAGIRFLGTTVPWKDCAEPDDRRDLLCCDERFLIADLIDANIKEINKHGRVKGVAVAKQTDICDQEFFGFADDLALDSTKETVALAQLTQGTVPEYRRVGFAKYANPQELNVGPPVPPFSSQMGFVNPIAYDNSDVVYAANLNLLSLSNGVYRLDSVDNPVEYRLYDTATGEFDTTNYLNAFQFGPDGKLYAPSPSKGSVFQIDLVESGGDTIAEYTEIITGLENPVSVRINEDGLLVVLDRDTGFVWKYDLDSDTEATFVASLEPGLDNFDFFTKKKILATANRNRLWEVNVETGKVKTKLASPVALPQAMDAGRSSDDSNILYVVDNYAILLVDVNTGDILSIITPFNTAGLSSFVSMSLVYAGQEKLYVGDRNQRQVIVLDRATLAPLDLFGGFIPGNIPFSQINYVLEDDQGNLLVALPANGQVIRVIRVAGQQINQTVVDNLSVPFALTREGSTLYISDIGTDDTNGAVYVHDLTSASTTATLLKDNLARPKGLTISGDDVLVVESVAAQITAIDKSTGDSYVVVDNLDIQYSPNQPTFARPVPVGVVSDITTTQSGAIFFGANKSEGAVQYLVNTDV